MAGRGETGKGGNGEGENVFEGTGMNYTLHCGDCLPFMQMMEAGIIDLTVTSPPYDNLRTYNGYIFDFEGIAKELYRVTKLGGIVVWIVGDATINGTETGSSFKQALYFMSLGFNLHDTMIYRKINYIPLTHNRYEQAFEYMLVFSKGRPNTFNPIKEKTLGEGLAYNMARKGYCATIKEGAERRRDEDIITKADKYKSNIFSYTCGGDRVGHPAPFPEELARDHILSWSNPGDQIFDPMCGSGTTGKMAILYQRRFIGCDISAEYIAIAERRIKDAAAQMLLPLNYEK